MADTTYEIDYNDDRFNQVENERQEAITEAENTYGEMINQSDKVYQDQINASKEWADKQSAIQQEQTDHTIDKIEQQKDKAEKDYTKEQAGAYTDWQKQSNQYGASAEQMAANGMAGGGYSESSKVSMYNSYQNRVATARESYNQAVLNYDNAIKDAQLANNSALADIAYKALSQQLEMPISDYWEYREGLAQHDTLAEKADYINSLDLPISKKNIMINNVAGRKEAIDMTGYNNFTNFEEFDYSIKNPEKYQFLKDNDISYKDYMSDETQKEEIDQVYSWVHNNPEKYTVSKAVTDDVFEYKEYTNTINAFRADKNKNGKSISGTAKKKVVAYIDSLDIDDGAKYIMFTAVRIIMPSFIQVMAKFAWERPRISGMLYFRRMRQSRPRMSVRRRILYLWESAQLWMAQRVWMCILSFLTGSILYSITLLAGMERFAMDLLHSILRRQWRN